MTETQRGVAWALSIAAVLALIALATTWLGWPPAPASPPPGVTLTDLAGVEDLRDRFNRDADSARVVVVLSPT